MIWFTLKRLGWMVLTVWVVFTATFFLMRAVPGGPYSSERKLPKEIEENFKARYRLNDPLWQQYLQQLGATARLDLGLSFKLADFSVNEIIVQGFPVSAALGLIALALALGLGVSAGTLAALNRATWIDGVSMGVATLGIAIPNFILASLLIILFAFLLPWFPAAGWGTLRHLALPACALALPYAAYIARLTRTGMLEVLGQDTSALRKPRGFRPSRSFVGTRCGARCCRSCRSWDRPRPAS